MDQAQQAKVSTQRERAHTFRTASSTGHPGSKRGYRHITVVPGRGRNAAKAITRAMRSAPALYLPHRTPVRPRYKRPSNG